MITSRSLNVLQNARIASPCNVGWENMTGNDRVRYCDQCEKNVYNLVDMPTEEAEAIILEHNGDLCIQIYQRRDGTLLTEDCPVGLRAARRKLKRAMSGLAATIAMLIGVSVTRGSNERRTLSLARFQPYAGLIAKLFPPPPAPVIRGKMIARGRVSVIKNTIKPNNQKREQDTSTCSETVNDENE